MRAKRTVAGLLIFSIYLMFVGGPLVGSQTIDLGGTPTTQDAVTTPPQFFIAAAGDFPEGYFRDVVVEPGNSVELTVTVVNSGEIPVDLRVYKVNAISGTNGGFIAGEEHDPDERATNWIDLEPFEVSLDPQQQYLHTFTVNVPKDTAPGQYMSGLLVRTADPVGIPGSTLLDQTIQYTISVSIVVPGEFARSFELGEPSVTARESDRRIAIPIWNTGNYLVKPAGEIVLKNGAGEVVHRSTVEMGSVYMNTSTQIWIQLPSQMPAGNYLLTLNLADPESGAAASIADLTISVPELSDGSGVYVGSATVTPNEEDIAYANVDIVLNNGGTLIPVTNVTLQVLHRGELVEEYPLAANQVMFEGENRYLDRYIPEDNWLSGTYTFRIVVESVDPNSADGTLLLDDDLHVDLVIP